MSVLDDLPSDILMYILDHYLDPDDIVQLLQTCTSICSLCSDRSIWLRKLREVSKRDDLFLPDFGPMSINEMKRAIFAPAHMSSLIWKKQSTINIIDSDDLDDLDDSEVSKIYPQTRRVLPFEMNDKISVVVLLPGGRYLVAKTKAQVVVIDTESKEPPPPQAYQYSTDAQLSSAANLVASPSIDGSRIRIAITEITDEKHSKRGVTVMEFDPEKSTLKRIGLHQINQNSSGLDDVLTTHHSDTLAGDLFCFLDSVLHEIYVWDFVKDIAVSWIVDPTIYDLVHRPLQKLMIHNEMKILIIFAVDVLLFWDLNEITSIKKSGRIATPFPPKWRKELDVRGYADPSTPFLVMDVGSMLPFFFSNNVWYHTRTLSPGFDVLLWNNMLGLTFTYTYEISYDPEKQGEPSIQLTQMHLIPSIHDHNIGIKHNRLCAGQTVLVWDRYEDERLFAIVKPTFIERDSNLEFVPRQYVYMFGAELAYTNDSDDRFSPPYPGLSTFDPNSGRLCTVSPDGKQFVINEYLGEFGVWAKNE